MSKNIGTEEKRQGTMSKTELAALYFPHISPANALRSFMRLINNHPGLMEDLEKANYRKNSHVLTPRQVSIIIQNLGDPEYYFTNCISVTQGIIQALNARILT